MNPIGPTIMILIIAGIVAVVYHVIREIMEIREAERYRKEKEREEEHKKRLEEFQKESWERGMKFVEKILAENKEEVKIIVLEEDEDGNLQRKRGGNKR